MGIQLKLGGSGASNLGCVVNKGPSPERGWRRSIQLKLGGMTDRSPVMSGPARWPRPSVSILNHRLERPGNRS